MLRTVGTHVGGTPKGGIRPPSSAPARAARGGRQVAVGLVAALVLVTTACTATAPEQTATATRSAVPSTSATPSATPTVSPPVLVPEGSAVDNLPYFRSIVAQVWGSADAARGTAYTDALTAAGFDRSTMQLTSDTTTIGQPAESIQFSVAWRDACLVGQVGPATGDPVVAVLPLLASGGCLIGATASVGG